MPAQLLQPQASAELAMPDGAVDSHAHVFGPVSRFALAEGRAYTPPDATVEAYVAMLDSLGLAHGVLVQGSAHGLDNAAMLNAIAMAAGRLR
ncbi:MAG: amidohydrolase family protein, partial [Casimicrobiaceae bacterium]